LNPRPPVPQTGALTRLRHAPMPRNQAASTGAIRGAEYRGRHRPPATGREKEICPKIPKNTGSNAPQGAPQPRLQAQQLAQQFLQSRPLARLGMGSLDVPL
jgi:hypothetical protein